MFGPPRKPWLWTEKTEGTSSARFGVRTAAKCCELKRSADRVRSRTQERESPQRQISVRNLLELFAFHFYSIDIRYFFSSLKLSNNCFAK